MKFAEGSDAPVANVAAANENLESLRLAMQEAQDLIRASSFRLLRAIGSYDRWWRDEFSREHDHFRLLGQDNFRRYLPFKVIRVRVSPQDEAFDIFARACAARVTGARVVVSSPAGMAHDAVKLLDELTDSWAAAIEFIEETDDQLSAHIRALPPHADERIRFAAPARVTDVVRAAAAETGVYLADEPVLGEGRVELLWYLREQSVCHDYHRYGNLGPRAGEARGEPL
jgi:RHH-type proline utilization regulon transcriptional repressor/proline dehydrogenase/delta 1-pyrroline-5-carboxylate dehydrogenase